MLVTGSFCPCRLHPCPDYANAALLQLLLGFVRPPATASSMLRSVWLLLHALFGRFALLLGGINVFIGIFLLGFLYEGEHCSSAPDQQ